MENNNFCVIMAGGVGSRFWPLSRSNHPKQFIDILGVGKTLIQLTYERFTRIMPEENIYIVSNQEYEGLIREQLPGLPKENILLEPMRRTTAPCIDYANYRIAQRNPNANIVVAPSDHLIVREEAFLENVREGLSFVAANDALLTLGIMPSRPETGYGYIQAVTRPVKGYEKLNLRKVKTFTEKPDLEMARIFFESGEFYWNSGIFFWSLPAIMKSFNEHLPEVHALFAEGVGVYGTEKEAEFINRTYEGCRNISIDFGIMEKAENVFVLVSDFGWSDLGTWGSLYEQSAKDKQKNAVNGKQVFLYNTSGSVINVPDDKLVVLHGLEDFIVVESDGVLLVCKKEEEQRIKQFVHDIQAELGDEHI